MRRLMGVLVLVVVATTARAQQNNGSAGYMLPLCRDWLKVAIDRDVDTVRNIMKSEPMRLTTSGMCAGFVVGVSETLTAFRLACPPGGVTNEQLVRMVVKQVESHPESMHEDFVVPVGAVMIATWPCRK